jgi:hypothetical protein
MVWSRHGRKQVAEGWAGQIGRTAAGTDMDWAGIAEDGPGSRTASLQVEAQQAETQSKLAAGQSGGEANLPVY